MQEVAALKLEARLRLEAVEKGLSLFPGEWPGEHPVGTVGQREPTAKTAEGVDMSGESATVRRIFRELVKQVDSADGREPE